jgi:hypothetical protein
VRRLNDSYACPFLVLDNLFVKLLHLGSVQLRAKMVLSMISIVKPKQVVPFVVGTDSPCDRLVRIAAIVKEIAIQVGAAMSQIIEREKEDPEFPVQRKANGDRRSQDDNFRNSPSRIDRIFSFDFGVDGFWIFPKVTEENVAPGVLRLTVMAVSIDRNPVVRVSVLIGPVAIPHMVPVMNMLVERLRNPKRYRFHDAEKSIKDSRFKERIMDEVVRDTVDIPGHAYRINQSHAHQDPPGRIGKDKKERDYVGEMEQSAENTNRIQFGIC